MDISVISEAVSNFGFPVVLVFILLYILYKEQEKHESEVDKLVEALNNNTTVMLELKTMVTDLKDMVVSLTARLEQLEGSDE